MLLDEKQRELQRRTESIRSLALGSFSKNGKGALCIAKRRAGERPFRAEDQQRAGGFSLTGSARASSERPVRGVRSEPRASKKTLILRFD